MVSAYQNGRDTFLKYCNHNASLPQNKVQRGAFLFSHKAIKIQVEQDPERSWKLSYCLEGRINYLYNILDIYLFNLFLRTSSNGGFTNNLGKKFQWVPNLTTSKPLFPSNQNVLHSNLNLFTLLMMGIKNTFKLGLIYTTCMAPKAKLSPLLPQARHLAR